MGFRDWKQPALRVEKCGFRYLRIDTGLGRRRGYSVKNKEFRIIFARPERLDCPN